MVTLIMKHIKFLLFYIVLACVLLLVFILYGTYYLWWIDPGWTIKAPLSLPSSAEHGRENVMKEYGSRGTGISNSSYQGQKRLKFGKFKLGKFNLLSIKLK